MSSTVKTDIAAEVLKRLLTSLPKQEVPVDWLRTAFADALSTVAGDSQSAESSVSAGDVPSAEPSMGAGDMDVLSLLDLSHHEPLRSTPGAGAAIPPLSPERYRDPAPLGVGGQGVVHAMTDQALARRVALKALRLELSAHRPTVEAFLREARLVAQLNHAGIVPVHDVGMLPEGTPCYTMRQVKGRSLKELLSAGALSRRRGVEVLVSAAHTLGYAHDRGVIHLDIKPSNLMVGDYGEVLVLDWGVALVLGRALKPEVEPIQLQTSVEDLNRGGMLRGTPTYMPPEQAAGLLRLLTPAADVFAVGMILYELLVGAPARESVAREQLYSRLQAELIEHPETRRQTLGIQPTPIPDELAEICLKCLSRLPNDRFSSGEELAHALQSWLDGERRRELAEKRALEADQKLNRLSTLNDTLQQYRDEARVLSEQVETWAPLEQKRKLWGKEDLARATEGLIDVLVNEAYEQFTQALGDDPDNARARAGLARIYHEQLLEAEFWGRQRDARRYEARLRQLDDGHFRTALSGEGVLKLQSDPPGAEVELYPYLERDRQRQPGTPRVVGTAPVEVSLPMGSYLVVVRDPRNRRELRSPVFLRRQETRELVVRLYPHLPNNFVLVPGGPFLFGGDRAAAGSPPREERAVEDFAIATYPVTCAEYLDFLNALARVDVMEAQKRAPRRPGGASRGPLWPVVGTHRFQIPERDSRQELWGPDFPVRSISRDDAEAYCRWRATRDRVPYRLPTEFEWEKAGRGVDGRWFPWGNEFDATFCKMKDSRPGAPVSESVGAFALDQSPYGVRDMAGGVIEWVAGPFDRHGQLAIQKGGFWLASAASCRLARRFGAFPGDPEPFAGFRLAFTPRW